ncbi:hypothetical protein [Bacteroides xylanisolvens]|jgi:hypothetical protein|nr:hypothetical protein [Bacteroides xylanisolvens]
MIKQRIKTGNFFLFLLVVILNVFFLGCHDDEKNISSEKGIRSFAFLKDNNPVLEEDVIGIINEDEKCIILDIQQENVDLSSLVASFEIDGFSSVAIGNRFQESGKTANNFFQPLNYTVTALDGSSVTYLVRVSYIQSSACDLLGMKLEQARNPMLDDNFDGIIDGGNVSFLLPVGTDLSSLVMSYTISRNATVEVDGIRQENGVTPLDFSEPRIVKVIAENATDYKEYIVTAEIISFKSYVITSVDDVPETFDVDYINNLTMKGADVDDRVLRTVAERIGSKEIRGNVRLEGTSATTLVGFADVMTIKGGYEFVDNKEITEEGLAPVSTLAEIEGDLVLSGFNTGKVWMNSFVNLKKIGGSLRLISANFDTNNTFSNLLEVGGDLEISKIVSSWTYNLQGMKVVRVEGDLIVNEADYLCSFKGFEKIEYIGGNVTITRNGKNVAADNLTWEAEGYKLINRFVRDGVIQPDALVYFTDKNGEEGDISQYGY